MESNKEYSSGEKAAKIISLLTISPFIIVAYLIFSTIVTQSIPLQVLLNIINGILFLAIPSLTLFYILKKSKVNNSSLLREARWVLYLAAFIVYVISFIFYVYVRYTFSVDMTPFFHLINAYLLINIVDCFITLGPTKFKTSMHMSNNGCSILVIFVIMDSFWFLLFLFLPLIFWARWKSKGHTIPQLISGTAIGLLIPLIYFYWYDSLLMTIFISSFILLMFIVFVIEPKFPEELE